MSIELFIRATCDSCGVEIVTDKINHRDNIPENWFQIIMRFYSSDDSGNPKRETKSFVVCESCAYVKGMTHTDARAKSLKLFKSLWKKALFYLKLYS